MNRRYMAAFFLLFTVISLADCSSAEKKNSSSGDDIIASKEIEAVRIFSEAEISDRKRISTLKIPSGYKPVKPQVITFSNDDIKVSLYAKLFAQGDGVYAEIEKQGGGSDLLNLKILFMNNNIPVTKTSWGFRALWGISPQEKPGKALVIISYNLNGKDNTLSSDIRIKDVDFPVSKKMLDVGKFSNKDYTNDPRFRSLILKCSALREKAFSSVSEDMIESTLSYPRDLHHITGDYWRKRTYLNYRKKGKKKTAVTGNVKFHRGVDLNGVVGAPVFAMADGKVVLSHTMFFEGNMVIVDHGNQIFSYYQHLNSRKVKTGDFVKAGDVIGGVGATGMVTGPHLHIAFSIRGLHIDPLSILSLPVSR